MNRQEQLLKNYILSEIYNIEKNQFLKEQRLILEFEDLLQEGRIGDFFKNAGNKIVDFFKRNPKEKETLQKLSKENRELYNKTGDKRKEEKAEFYENLDMEQDASYFRRNATLWTLALVVISLLELYPNNPDMVDKVYDETNKELSQNKKRPRGPKDIIEYLKSKAVRSRSGLVGSKGLEDVYGEEDNINQTSQDNPVAVLFQELIKNIDELEAVEAKTNAELQVLNMEHTSIMNRKFESYKEIVDLTDIFDSKAEYRRIFLNPDYESLSPEQKDKYQEVLERISEIEPSTYLELMAKDYNNENLRHKSKDESPDDYFESLNHLIYDIKNRGQYDEDDATGQFISQYEEAASALRIKQMIDDYSSKADPVKLEEINKKIALEKGWIDEDGNPTNTPAGRLVSAIDTGSDINYDINYDDNQTNDEFLNDYVDSDDDSDYDGDDDD